MIRIGKFVCAKRFAANSDPIRTAKHSLAPSDGERAGVRGFFEVNQ
jgi:hypothetical protein